MLLSLREAIIQRVQNKSREELLEVIEGSIDGEERILPGLGVLFEMIWKESSSSTQDQLVQDLQAHLTHLDMVESIAQQSGPDPI